MGARRKARECALQMLFAADVADPTRAALTRDFWDELSDYDADQATRDFANNLAIGTLSRVKDIDRTIKTRAEHWRIERMAIVDRNILRLAVNEFLFEETPHTVIINEALEIARRFSTFEATQFINGILDAIKKDLKENPPEEDKSEKKTDPGEKSRAKSS
ncbi:MAG: transcription antitermination factor NusB [Acidobacteriota bacterium]|nr:transcription antitermination factor NusB [Acidobacteriota bacterium]MDH3528936.1 transcription antitermination factor NusB [Acidobacteriota bacterium]